MANTPRDGYERYYQEKLWELIPSIYRHEDGLAENPGVLRALVEILANQAAIVRRSNDRLWEDQFIELSSDWVVPYIGDLLSTRLVSALNRRGRRIDVAKTIYYRRRKGTLRILEELISDIGGWEGVAVENFRRLGRTRHGLDPFPAPLAGRLSGTQPGGWADLRRAHAAELAHTAFDEYHHTADIRRHTGFNGRYAIPKLAFHLYRLRAFRVEGVTPFVRADGVSFTFDPSGRDIPLFRPRARARDFDDWRTALEWEVPAAIPCRLLGDADFVISEGLVQRLINDLGLSAPAAADLRTLRGYRFVGENRLRATLETLSQSAALVAPAVYNVLLAGALVDDCGKANLIPAAVRVEEAPGSFVQPELIVSAGLSTWSANPPRKRLAIDPELGRFLFLGGAPATGITVKYHYGFSGQTGAGTYDRAGVEDRQPDRQHSGGGALVSAEIADNGITQIDDSATYGPVDDKTSVQNMTLQAANQQRPYIRLQADWVLDSGLNQDSTLLLDGLWLGCDGPNAVVLVGDWEKVTVRSCTFDPGGVDVDGNPIEPLTLIIEGQVENLMIEFSIMGPIAVRSGGIVESVCIHDSILQSTRNTVLPLDLPAAAVELQQVTILGGVNVNRLWASEALITGLVDVTDTQEGCFRFSAAPPGSRLPRSYQSVVLADSRSVFTSTRFGQPGYAQLSEISPLELRRGAENGSEIGAFSNLISPIKLDSLKAKIDEYMPFGLIPISIMET
jgi:hypothetical protein